MNVGDARRQAAGEDPATRADLETATAAIRSEIVLLRSEWEAKTDLLRSAFEARTDLLRNEFEARLQAMAKELVKWFAGILLAHGIAVIGVTVTLVKLL